MLQSALSCPHDESRMETLRAYWSAPEIVANGIIFLHLLGALAVGIVLGYERSYHGRAAGMRTYVLVCLTSTALTVVNAYPGLWYGGLVVAPTTGDPTRVIQGILAGMGFLGAGVIIRDGMTIRGLSTAASLWMTAGIGVLIGVGFYAAAIAATTIAITVMSGFRWVERVLPHQTSVHLSLTYPRHHIADRQEIIDLIQKHGYQALEWSYTLEGNHDHFRYDLVLIGPRHDRTAELVDTLKGVKMLRDFMVAPARN